jgi:DNA polymerase-3 subunit delta
MAKAKPAILDASTRVLALHGPEDAVKQDYIANLRKNLEKVHGELDTHAFDGKIATLSDVFDEVRGYSLMGGYKLVIVDPADDFVKAHREALERYASAPVDHATLVLRAGAWHRGKLDKAIDKVGAVIKCEPPKPAEAVKRLIAHAKSKHQVALEKPAAHLLVDRLGVQLVRLETEVDKLAAMVGGSEGSSAITADMVEQSVGKASDEKAWEVQEAVLQSLADGSGRAALDKTHELIETGGQPAILVMYFISDLARKLAVGGQMKADGASDSEIGRALKLWGPRQGLFMRVLKSIGSIKAARLLQQALDADARSKSGFGDAERNLEGFCAVLADV